ncbi:MAG: hypothetical protein OEV43_06940 [Coriobacteriia bacterium]|nr:hypothetical protein [Coriobacteriia bacterium]
MSETGSWIFAAVGGSTIAIALLVVVGPIVTLMFGGLIGCAKCLLARPGRKEASPVASAQGLRHA